MLPDRVSNLGPLTYESGVLPIALRGPAISGCNCCFSESCCDTVVKLFTSGTRAFCFLFLLEGGWSGGAMVLGKLPVLGRPTILMIVGQGPIALAVGAGGGCLDIFTLIYPFSPLSPSLWETARYRLKYCLKGPLNPKQPTNQPTF